MPQPSDNTADPVLGWASSSTDQTSTLAPTPAQAQQQQQQSGQTYASVTSTDGPISAYGTEDVDPRDHLEALRLYEGEVDGHNWAAGRIGGVDAGSGGSSTRGVPTGSEGPSTRSNTAQTAAIGSGGPSNRLSTAQTAATHPIPTSSSLRSSDSASASSQPQTGPSTSTNPESRARPTAASSASEDDLLLDELRNRSTQQQEIEIGNAPWRSLYTLGNDQLDMDRMEGIEAGPSTAGIRGDREESPDPLSLTLPQAEAQYAEQMEAFERFQHREEARRAREYRIAPEAVAGSPPRSTSRPTGNIQPARRRRTEIETVEDSSDEEDEEIYDDPIIGGYDQDDVEGDGGDDGIGRFGLPGAGLIREPSLNRGGNNMRRRNIIHELIARSAAERAARNQASNSAPAAASTSTADIRAPRSRMGLPATNIPINGVLPSPLIRSTATTSNTLNIEDPPQPLAESSRPRPETTGQDIDMPPPAESSRAAVFEYGHPPAKRRRFHPATIGPPPLTRPTYLSLSTIPTSTPIPLRFCQPTRNSRLSLTTHTPEKNLYGTVTYTDGSGTHTRPTITHLPPRHLQPKITFTTTPIPTRTDSDASSLRTLTPIPSACGVHYFEIKVLDSGPEGYMSVGWVKEGLNMRRLVGWEMGSWGWHADDGRCFEGSGMGGVFGPKWGVGDIIGAGIDYTTRRAFFTKNGVLIGNAFKNLPLSGLYPAIGLRNPKETIAIDFVGPFKYDIDSHVLRVKEGVLAGIATQQISDIPVLKSFEPGLITGEEGRKEGLGIEIEETILTSPTTATPIPIPTATRPTIAPVNESNGTPVVRRAITMTGMTAVDQGGSSTTRARNITRNQNPPILPVTPINKPSPSDPSSTNINQSSSYIEPHNRTQLAFVLDYLAHTGMDKVHTTLLNDLENRKTFVHPIISIDKVGTSTINQICDSIKRGNRIEYGKLNKFDWMSMNKAGLDNKMLILDLVAMAKPKNSNDVEGMVEIDDDAMVAGKQLLKMAKDQDWGEELKGWVNEAVACVCGVSNVPSIGEGKDGEDVWVQRRKKWAEELRSWMRNQQGLKPQSYLEQALRQSRALIDSMEGIIGSGAFVDPKSWVEGYGMKDVKGKKRAVEEIQEKDV